MLIRQELPCHARMQTRSTSHIWAPRSSRPLAECNSAYHGIRGTEKSRGQTPSSLEPKRQAVCVRKQIRVRHSPGASIEHAARMLLGWHDKLLRLHAVYCRSCTRRSPATSFACSWMRLSRFRTFRSKSPSRPSRGTVRLSFPLKGMGTFCCADILRV